ncbi:MAG: PepSY domain-containing protein [Rhodanobacter sp.]
MNASFRNYLSWFHTWSGLTIGFAIVMFAVTGAGLVVRPELDDVINRDLLITPVCRAPLPLEAMDVAARAAHPSSRPYAIEITRAPAASNAVRFANDDYVYIDPCTARVLGIRNLYGGFFGTMEWLHRFKFIGHGDGSGKVVGGWANAIFAALLIVGGLILWWPRRRAEFRSALAFQWRRSGSARTLSLHKIAGLYCSSLLLVIALTALPLAFQPFRQLIGWVTHSSVNTPAPPKLERSRIGARLLTMDALWQRTLERVPNIVWASLYYPAAHSAVAHAEILESGMPNRNAKTQLYLNMHTGNTIRLDRYKTGIPEGRKVYLFLLALHSGLVGGLPYQLLLLLAVLGIPVQFYSGASVYIRQKLRKRVKANLSLRLVHKAVEAEGICSFAFSDPKGTALPPFSAGSHIDVETGNGVTRQYSLCNDPLETHRYVICVLLHADSRGGSRGMHENLAVGDLVQISAPRNHFPLAHSASRSLLLAAGIGVTPLLCMAERLSNVGAEFSMHYCVRSLAQAAFVERIKKSAFADRVTFHVSSEGGRLDISSLLKSYRHETHIYVCGSNAFIDSVSVAAGEMGWPEAHMHREHFSASGHMNRFATSFDLKIASTGKLIHVAPDETAAAALRRCGLDIPVSCAEGLCGTCLTKVIEGDIEHNDLFLTAEERTRNDQFTPCCSRAKSPTLVLDL